MDKRIRLDRFLADMGKGSRSQIRQAAKKGRIQVNGCTEKQTDRKIDPVADVVTLDGSVVSYQVQEYFMLNKPQGVVSATEDARYRTVIDLLEGEKRRDLFPVGRLDRDIEGLLLLTNDGELAHQLLSPKKHVDKTYFARIEGELPADAVERMAAGMVLEDQTSVRPARLTLLGRHVPRETSEQKLPHAKSQEASEQEVLLTIQEGKFHQVKRMFEVLGCRVVYLKRLSMGPLTLDESLRPGEYRRLTAGELEALKTQAGRQREREEDKVENKIQSRQQDNGLGIRQALGQTDAVIFDLDGTLVDSMWMWKAIDIEYLGRYGYDCPPSLQREIEGMSFSETASYFKETFGIPDTLEEIKQAWVEMSIEKYRHEVPLKEGVRPFLELLQKKGIAMGIATSNGRAMVDAVLEALDIAPFFQVIATACEVAAGKPAPDIYLHVAQCLGVRPERCMVFEDVPAGILAGKAAGMAVCAVKDDFSAGMQEEKLRLADYSIEDYRQLLEEIGRDGGERNG